jgi:hypothetical protein
LNNKLKISCALYLVNQVIKQIYSNEMQKKLFTSFCRIQSFWTFRFWQRPWGPESYCAASAKRYPTCSCIWSPGRLSNVSRCRTMDPLIVRHASRPWRRQIRCPDHFCANGSQRPGLFVAFCTTFEKKRVI